MPRARLNGAVMCDDYAKMYRWWDENVSLFCPEDVRNIINSAPDGETIVLELNSGGGHVQAGQEIYAVLEAAKAAGREIIVEVQSIAASAASVLMLGASRVRISPPAQVMIHRAAVVAEGNVDDFERTIQQLNSTDRAMLSAYSRKCGDKATKRELFNMMKKETFLTSDEALKIGLVDEVIGVDDVSFDVVASMQDGFRAAASPLPDINEVISAYHAAHPSNSWKTAAEKWLTIESIK